MIRILTFCLATAFAIAFATAALAQGVGMAPLSPKSGRMITDYLEAAEGMFPRMPAVRLTSNIGGTCGGGAGGNELMRYCTSENSIFVSNKLADEIPDDGRAGYMIAHLMGHAAQVRHGIATDALAAIRAEPARESELRGMVTRQVECLAGVFFAAAGGPRSASLTGWYAEEPFIGAHWGRAPLSAGQQVAIGLAARDAAFRRGLEARDITVCAEGEIGVEKLLRVLRPQ